MIYGARNAARVVPAPSPSTDPSIRRSARAMLRVMDLNVIIVDDVKSLRRACLNASVDVVRLRVGAEYRLAPDLEINHPVLVQGAPGARVLPYSAAHSPEFVVNTSGTVELSGLRLAVPLRLVSAAECHQLRMEADYGTAANGALIDVLAAGAGLHGCRSTDGTAAVGVYVDPAAAGARMVGCDFALHATPYRIAAAAGAHYGPDANHGAVTLF